ncbi:MAG: hypothetical protein H6623_00130 [Bdellovibrionaceae bacterium]|nr:hypothetical protein [Pseudobdellovibrionaceae bacterium]
MDKVTSYNFSPMNFSPSAAPSIRGHHSSINAAVSAHRQMVEERSSRNAYHQMANTTPIMVAEDDMYLAPSVQNTNNNVSAEPEYYERDVIDVTGSPMKQSLVQAFQTNEPDRPSPGDPIPKGSYLDVEA